MKVLIVDDDLVDRRLIQRTLNKSSAYVHDVTEATSVKEGLAALDKQKFDVILLDYNMPQVDGIEMVIEMRAKPGLGETAIVMVSASDDSELALHCIEVGAQDFLPKNEISDGKLNKAILHARKRFDIEQRMHESYLTVKRMAERDALTGLSNRYHFEEILKVMLANNKRSKDSVALLAMDLDEFKNVNDTLGHDVGDQVLVEAVGRIAGCLRENEGFARLGGDEFAVILGGIENIRDVTTIANRICAQFDTPFLLDGHEINCGVSIGAAVCPSDAVEPHELMKCADIAMYRSKQSDKGGICFYQASYQAEFYRRALIKNEIGTLLKQGEFRLFYQPYFYVESGGLAGVEALIRWPNGDPMYVPDEFIPIAEETRLIESLGKWVVTEAVSQLAAWRKEHDLPLVMSINVSPVQLQHDELLPLLTDTVTQAGLLATDIVLEITETALFKDNDKTVESLTALSQQGFKIALDDFGMGFSSISHLMNYPIDIVKLDKSMQAENSGPGKQREILEGLSLMLRKLGFEIVAEGIETDQQRELCTELGLDKLQGFLLAKPMPAEEFNDMLSKVGSR